MDLSQKLESYPKEYWNFSNYRKNNSLVKYPAIMVAPMQECIIREVISSDASIKNICDPFSGDDVIIVTRGENSVNTRVLKLP